MSSGMVRWLLITASLLVVCSEAQDLFAVTSPDNGTVIPLEEPPVAIMCQPQRQEINIPVMLLNATWLIDGIPSTQSSVGSEVVSSNTILIFGFETPSIMVTCLADGFPDEILATFTVFNSLVIVDPIVTTAIVNFNSSVVTVSEGVNAVLCVTASFDVPGPGIIELQAITTDVTASANQDYDSLLSSQPLSLGVTNSVACLRIATFVDDITEGVETFNVTLQLATTGENVLVFIDQGVAEVRIVETCIDGEVRLRGGFDELQGRVEVCFNATWGTVCDDGWDDTDARVVCSQLGYPGPFQRGIPGAVFGPGQGPILLRNVECSFDDIRITNCSLNGFGNNLGCFHYEDASVDCLGRRVGEACPDEGSVRLVNGRDENQGQVEICAEGTWGKICGLDWDNNDAQVVCRQLGLSESGAVGFNEAVFGPGVGEIASSRFACTGNEMRLENCSHAEFFSSSCDILQDASVDCLGRSPALTMIGFDNVPSSVREGESLDICVSVLEGELLFDYDIEISVSTFQASIPDDVRFSLMDDFVLITLRPDNPQFCFTAEIIDDLQIEAPEQFALHLNVFSLRYVVLRDRDIQITIIDNTPRVGFIGDTTIAVEEGGSVQVCVRLLEGTLFGSANFTLTTDAERFLIKRQTGQGGPARFEEDYIGGFQVPFVLTNTMTEFCTDITTIDDDLDEGEEVISMFLFHDDRIEFPLVIDPPRQVVIILDNDVECGNGSLCVSVQFGISRCIESIFVCDGLFQCPDGSDERDCIMCDDDQFSCPSEDLCLPLAYRCDGIPDCQTLGFFDIDESNCSTGCMNGDLRPLVGGTSDSEGIVEVCFNGMFRPLYLEFRAEEGRSMATIREASVICQQLGLGNVGIPLDGEDSFGFELLEINPRQLFGGERRLFLSCPLGTETRVSECRLLEGDVRTQMGVRCMDATPCINGSVRLADGPDEREGRVEVCFQNAWGVVSDSNWEPMDAAVVCRQLGYDSNGALPIYPSLYGAPNNAVRSVVLQNPTCSLEDTNLVNCRTALPFGQSNVYGEDAFFSTVGVRCEAYPSGSCEDRDVRLAMRQNPDGTSGLVEICSDGMWKPLAASSVNVQVADVICRQLGFSGQFDTFVSTNVSLNAPLYTPLLPCGGSEPSLVLCQLREARRRRKRVTENELQQAGVRCQAPPRIVLDPPSLDGVYKVELGRRISVQCRLDPRYFPNVPTFQVLDSMQSSGEGNVPIRLSKRGIDFGNGQSRSVFSTSRATENDSGEFVCVAENANGMRTEQMVQIQVLAPEGAAESAFIRFSFPTLERLNAASPDDDDFLNREETLNDIQELVASFIDVDTPGLQTVDCKFLSSGMLELERRLDRVECNITQFQSQGEPFVPVSQIAQRVSSAVSSSFSIFVLNETAVNGFCDSEVTMVGGQSFSWPEASSGITVIITCPFNSSVTVSRVCSGSGQWEEPDLTSCQQPEFCVAESSSLPGEAAVYDWPQTPVGENATIPCIASDGLIRRTCFPDGEWDTFDDDVCGTLDDGLEMLLNQRVNNNTYVGLTSELSIILNVSEGNVADQGQGNLAMVAQVFEMVADFVNGSDIEIERPVVQSLVQSVSSLLQWNDTVLIDESSSNIVESFEVVVVLYAQQVEIGENDTIVIEDLLIVAERAPLELLQETGRGFSFSETPETELPSVALGDGDQVTPGVLAPQEVAAIRLPASLFQTIQNGSQTPDGSVGIYFAVYDIPSLFPLNEENENRTVASRILATTVGPFFDIDNLTEPVSIALRLTQNASQIQPETEMCVSWDFLLDEWTTEGCVTGVGGDGVVTCNCTHLTNFAVLVDICSRIDGCSEREPIDEVLEKALDYISIIGVTISMVGLVLTVITMLIFKKIRQKDASKYHIQLSIAIFCMLLVFIVGIERTENYGGCVTVSVLIHYFTLVAVMWMGAEALLMFQKLVIVFFRITTKYIVILSFICWLVPLLPVAIPLIVDLSTGNNTDPEDDIVVNREQFCFLNHPGAFFGAFLALIFIVIIFNLVIFVTVIYVLLKHTRGQLSRQQERMKPATAVRLMISITGVMFLFGLSWLFAALTITVPGVREAGQVLFTIFSSLQGFFIFLFFCVFSKEARESWKELLSFGKYKSELLHPSQYKQPTSSATAKRNFKTVSGGTGSTGIDSTTVGRPYTSETISKTDYNSETLVKTDYSSEAPKEALDLQTEERYTEIPLTNGHESSFKGTPEPEKTVVIAETNVDAVNGDSIVQSQDVANGKEEKALKARIKRFSTKKAQKHHIESVEVDFYSDESSEGEEIA